MYRFILAILLLFFSIVSNGQTWIIQNNGVKTTINSNGSFVVDSNLLIPSGDTIKPSWWNPGHTYNGSIKLFNGALYYYFGTKWNAVGSGGGGGSGTVTSITAGYGLAASPGNPITTSGVLIVDSGRGPYQLVTGYSLNKVRDSLQGNINGKMSYADTTSLSNRINAKQNFVDTNTYDATKSNLRDTAVALRALIATKQNTLTLTTAGTSGAATLIGATLNIPNYTTGGGGADSVTFATNYRVDTAKSNIRASISTKLNISDSTAMLASYINSANNGLTKSGKTVLLGGALTGATTITTTGVNTLSLAGLQSGAASDSVLTVDATTGVLKRRFFPTPGGSGISGSGTANQGAKFTGTSSIGNSLYYDDGTNIGFRTTSPLTPFQVNVGTNMEMAMYVNSDGFPNIGAYNTSGSALIAMAVNGNFLHLQNGGGANNLVIGANTVNGFGKSQFWGNVWMNDNLGLGTSSVPAYKIDAVGTIRGTNITASSSTPGFTAGAGAGTGPTVTITGTYNNYTVTLTVGSAPAGGATILTITGFPTSSVNMSPVWSGGTATEALSGSQRIGVTGTTTTHIITAGAVPPVSGATYVINVISIPKF